MAEVIIGIAVVLGLLLWAASMIIGVRFTAPKWLWESPGSFFAGLVAMLTLVLARYAYYDQRSLPWTVLWSALCGIAAYAAIRLWRD